MPIIPYDTESQSRNADFKNCGEAATTPSEPFEPERRRRLSIRRLYDFRRQRRYKKWRPKGRHTFPAERCYIPPEGGALNPPVRRSRSQAEPWQPRAERPGGWLNPHARKGVSTFGNTAPRRFLTKVHDFRRRRCPIVIPPLPPIWCIIKKNSLFVSPREGVLHA